MRNIIVVVVASIALAGCTSLDRAKLSAKWVGISDKTVNDVVQGAVKVCQFAPEIDFVRQLFSTGKYAKFTNAAGAAIADICRAVTTQPMAEGPGVRKPPVIMVGKGKAIVVRGTFVR